MINYNRVPTNHWKLRNLPQAYPAFHLLENPLRWKSIYVIEIINGTHALTISRDLSQELRPAEIFIAPLTEIYDELTRAEFIQKNSEAFQ